MTSISAVSQKEQPTLTTSEQKQSASIFNNPRAMESSPQAASQETKKVTTVEDEFNSFVKECANEYSCRSKVKEEDIVDFLAQLGFTKEKVLQMSKDEFLYEIAPKLTGLIEFVFDDTKNIDKKKECLIKMSKYTDGNLDELQNYADNIQNADFKAMFNKILKSTNVVLPDKIAEKLKKVDDISELSQDELTMIISKIFENKESLKEAGVDTNLLLIFIFNNIDDKTFQENILLRELIIAKMDELSCKNEISNNAVFLAMIEKLSNSKDGLESVLNSTLFDNIFNNLKDGKDTELFLLKVQSIIDNSTQDQKTIFADKIAKYLDAQLTKVNKIIAKDQSARTPDEINFLAKYNRLEKQYQAATGYAYVRAQQPLATSLHKIGEKVGNNFNKNAYQYAYDYSLKDKNVNPVYVTTKIDKISNNQYSQVLQELGYELPTNKNLDDLRALAENGVFEKRIQSSYNNDNTYNGIGYNQQSTTIIDNANAKAGVLFSSIVNNTDEQTGNVNKTSENTQEQATLFNKTNLSNYSGSELSDLISNGFMKFSDAVKQYTTHLSDSGKRFVVQSIKVMDDGRQTFALNSTSNTARWEIMKKADLLDENLNVDFDFNHEKLREKYQA